MTGELTLVSLGPGSPDHRTAAADRAIRHAEVVVGYEYYLELCSDLTTPSQELISGRMGEEAERANVAVRRAAAGARVALVSTGDIGVYGMASLVLRMTGELPAEQRPAVRVLPGVTAAVAAASLLGAPLARDFACLTLSDVLAPWELVEQRLRALAVSGLVLALYNPRSRARPWQLDRARAVLLESRSPTTPVGLVTNAAREGEQTVTTTLGELSTDGVGMNTVLIVGGTGTSLHGEWMVTDRALRNVAS